MPLRRSGPSGAGPRLGTKAFVQNVDDSVWFRRAIGLPKERIWMLMERVVKDELSIHDPAIRAWALYDEEAARVVRRVDRKRLRTVTALFREAGFSEDQAAARARLLAVYLIADGSVFVREAPARRRELARLRWELLVRAD